VKGYDTSFDSSIYHQISKNMFDGTKEGIHVIKNDRRNTLYYLDGVVKEISMPNYSNPDAIDTLYNNDIFARRILNFQADWITNKVKLEDRGWTQKEIRINDIQYIETIKPIIRDGQVQEMVYTLSSLQPLTKAADLMSDYYIYVIAFVLVLSLIVSFYYSRIITKPLLKINEA
ncbi:two-component sensor histidine kinase, partial [Bacillus thuringiensis]